MKNPFKEVIPRNREYRISCLLRVIILLLFLESQIKNFPEYEPCDVDPPPMVHMTGSMALKLKRLSSQYFRLTWTTLNTFQFDWYGSINDVDFYIFIQQYFKLVSTVSIIKWNWTIISHILLVYLKLDWRTHKVHSNQTKISLHNKIIIHQTQFWFRTFIIYFIFN